MLFIDLPVTYQISSRTALFVDSKVAAFGENTKFGLGVGVNYEVDRGLQLIGEITPVFDGSLTV